MLYIFLSDAPYHDPPDAADAAAIIFACNSAEENLVRGMTIAAEQIQIGGHRAVIIRTTGQSNADLLAGVLLACAARGITPQIIEYQENQENQENQIAGNGDLIAEMIDLIARINQGNGWRIWRIDQNPLAPSPGSALLTLRDPTGSKLLLMFNQAAISVSGSVRMSQLAHLHINRRIAAAWQEKCAEWKFALPPTRQQDETVITAHGEIHSITLI